MNYYQSKDFKKIISATFPEYRRHQVRVEVATSVTFHDLNWSGGTKSEYRACTVDGRALPNRVDMGSPAPWVNKYENLKIDLLPDTLIVRGGHFCGKAAMLTIFVHPENMPKLIPVSV